MVWGGEGWPWPNAVNLRFSRDERPERDLRSGWEGPLVLSLLAWEAAAGLLLLAGEAAHPLGPGEQVAGVGDLVDDVVEEFGELVRGERPRRR